MTLDRLPATAEVVMQSVTHASRTIVRRLRGTPVEPFKYRDLGSMATISPLPSDTDDRSAPALRLARLFVQLGFLTGFKNRVATVAGWTVAFIGHGQPERAITTEEARLD
jgi:NADH dehydrogenase